MRTDLPLNTDLLFNVLPVNGVMQNCNDSNAR